MVHVKRVEGFSERPIVLLDELAFHSLDFSLVVKLSIAMSIKQSIPFEEVGKLSLNDGIDCRSVVGWTLSGSGPKV